MGRNNTHSQYKNQVSIQLPSSSIDVWDAPTRYFFQGKWLDASIDKSKMFLSILVTMPLGVNKWPVGEGELFEEVTVQVYFQSLLIGKLNSDTLEVKLEDNDNVLSTYKGKVFRGDFGSPNQHGVDDQEFQLMINVHFKKNPNNISWDILEFIIPTTNNEIPYIKAVVKDIEIYNTKGEKLNREEMESLMKPFYEDDFVNEKDRMKLEWDVLHGIKNSFEFYQNRLRNWHWFKYQFEPNGSKTYKIESSTGDLLRPLWVECDAIAIDDDGLIENVSINRVTKCKATVQMSDIVGEMWWLPPEDYGSLLTFLSNELVNSTAENPFEEVLVLYISKWEPNDTIDKCLPYDLQRIVEADPILSQHNSRSIFFERINEIVAQRGLVWV